MLHEWCRECRQQRGRRSRHFPKGSGHWRCWSVGTSAVWGTAGDCVWSLGVGNVAGDGEEEADQERVGGVWLVGNGEGVWKERQQSLWTHAVQPEQDEATDGSTWAQNETMDESRMMRNMSTDGMKTMQDESTDRITLAKCGTTGGATILRGSWTGGSMGILPRLEGRSLTRRWLLGVGHLAEVVFHRQQCWQSACLHERRTARDPQERAG